MESISQAYEVTPVEDLIKHPKNPRKGDIAKIKESIQANGFGGALWAQKSTGHIIAGNHRYEAALALGATHLPVIWMDVDDDEALRLLLADNRTQDLAEYDKAGLADLLNELHDETDPDSLFGTGFSSYDLAEIERKVKLADVPLDFDGANPDDDGAAPPTLPGDAPLRDSHVYMVQLYLNNETAPIFLQKAHRVREAFGAENITDTVVELVNNAYTELEGCAV